MATFFFTFFTDMCSIDPEHYPNTNISDVEGGLYEVGEVIHLRCDEDYYMTTDRNGVSFEVECGDDGHFSETEVDCVETVYCNETEALQV